MTEEKSDFQLMLIYEKKLEKENAESKSIIKDYVKATIRLIREKEKLQSRIEKTVREMRADSLSSETGFKQEMYIKILTESE